MNFCKRILAPVSISLALLGFAGTTQAQSDSGFYVGAGMGRTTFETRQVTSSIPPQTLTVKDSSNSTRVFAGFRASRYIFIEAGATAFGDLTEEVGSDGPQIFQASYGGWDLSLIGNIPLADGAFDIFAKAGVARTVYDTRLYDAFDPSFGVDSLTRTTQRTAMYGLGGQFNFGSDRQMGLRVEGNSYDVSQLAKDQYSVFASFVYRF